MHLHSTLEYFSQNKEYNEIGWLLLIALEKLGKQKDKFRASNL